MSVWLRPCRLGGDGHDLGLTPAARRQTNPDTSERVALSRPRTWLNRTSRQTNHFCCLTAPFYTTPLSTLAASLNKMASLNHKHSTTIALILALLALLSFAAASQAAVRPPTPSTCLCQNGFGSQLKCGDACTAFCTGRGTTVQKCVAANLASSFATADSAATAASLASDAEAHMVAKAMFAIPCDLCEVAIGDIQRIKEANCVQTLDNACKIVQKKFPQVKCSSLIETLACGVVRTLLANVNPQQVCSKYARCQVPDAALLQAQQLEQAAVAVNGAQATVQCQCVNNGNGNSFQAVLVNSDCGACNALCHQKLGPNNLSINCNAN
jgi:hypothetical protein